MALRSCHDSRPMGNNCYAQREYPRNFNMDSYNALFDHTLSNHSFKKDINNKKEGQIITAHTVFFKKILTHNLNTVESNFPKFF